MLQYGSQLANHLSQYLRVIQILPEGADKDLFRDDVNIYKIDYPNSYLSSLKLIYNFRKAVKKILRTHDIDVIHITGRNPLFLTLVKEFRSFPFFYTIHDVVPHSGEYKIQGELVDQLLVRISHKTFVHGSHNADLFEKKYPNNYYYTIPHGEFRFYTEYCNSSIEYKPEILFFGRIKEYKGIETLLQAEHYISKKYTDYSMIVAGSGKVTSKQKEHIKKSDNIELINRYIENKEVCELFSRCRMVILPYKDASQTGVIPIAYSFRKPVIATQVGGLPEMVQHGKTGFLVESEKPQNLAQYCAQLLENKELCKKLGNQGERFSKDELNWDHIAAEITNEYAIDPQK